MKQGLSASQRNILATNLRMPPHHLGERADLLIGLADQAAWKLESPIEWKFAVAMAIHHDDSVSRFPTLLLPDLQAEQSIYACFRGGDALSFLFPQVQVEDMRIDFLHVFRAAGRRSLITAIECDGHDFHERTAEQARRDRHRDRRLQQLGYRVFRFTGSEIWADALNCAKQVAQLIRSATGAPTATQQAILA